MKKFVIMMCSIFLFCCFGNRRESISEGYSVPNSDRTNTKEKVNSVEKGKEKKSGLAKSKKNADSIVKINYEIDKKLPLGPDVLINYSFPKNEFSFITNENDDVSKNHQEKFYEVIKYYSGLEAIHPDVEPSRDIIFGNVKYLKLNNEDFSEIHDLFQSNSLISFTYRLENIGPYEAYLKIKENDYGECGHELKNLLMNECCYDFENCKEKGFLILYKRRTQDAIVLNPFYIQSEDEGTSFRLFYFSKNNTIHIYEAYSDVDDYDEDKINNQIDLIHRIEIGDNGDINVYNIDYKKRSDEELTYEDQNEISENKKKQKRLFLNYRDSILKITKPIIEKYPFGAKQLIEHQFPNEDFEIILSKSKNKTNFSSTFLNIWNYYFDINKPTNNTCFLPPIKEYKKIQLQGINEWSNGLHSINTNLKDPFANPKFNFRLPNIANYEVYYLSNLDNESNCDLSEKFTFTSLFNNCDVNGILLLYDSKTQVANIANVYSISSNPTNVSYRFFYIHNDKIHIFEGYGNHNYQNIESSQYSMDEDENHFSSKGKYKINHTDTFQIFENGEIKISQSTNNKF